jgi:hypothetical protein
MATFRLCSDIVGRLANVRERVAVGIVLREFKMKVGVRSRLCVGSFSYQALRRREKRLLERGVSRRRRRPMYRF